MSKRTIHVEIDIVADNDLPNFSEMSIYEQQELCAIGGFEVAEVRIEGVATPMVHEDDDSYRIVLKKDGAGEHQVQLYDFWYV